MKMRLRSSGPEPSAARASRMRAGLEPTPVSTSVQPSSFSNNSTLMVFFSAIASTL
jgi:hypothetical protein